MSYRLGVVHRKLKVNGTLLRIPASSPGPKELLQCGCFLATTFSFHILHRRSLAIFPYEHHIEHFTTAQSRPYRSRLNLSRPLAQSALAFHFCVQSLAYSCPASAPPAEWPSLFLVNPAAHLVHFGGSLLLSHTSATTEVKASISSMLLSWVYESALPPWSCPNCNTGRGDGARRFVHSCLFYHMSIRTPTDSNHLIKCMMERCREWMRKGSRKKVPLLHHNSAQLIRVYYSSVLTTILQASSVRALYKRLS